MKFLTVTSILVVAAWACSGSGPEELPTPVGTQATANPDTVRTSRIETAVAATSEVRRIETAVAATIEAMTVASPVVSAPVPPPTAIASPTKVAVPTPVPTSTPVPTRTPTPSPSPSPTPQISDRYSDASLGWSIDYPIAAEISRLENLTEFGYGYRDSAGAQLSIFYFENGIQDWPDLDECIDEFRDPQPLLHSAHRLISKYQIAAVKRVELNGVSSRLRVYDLIAIVPGGSPPDASPVYLVCGITGADVFFIVGQVWPAIGEAELEDYVLSFTPEYAPPAEPNDPDLLPLANSLGANFGSIFRSSGSRYTPAVRLAEGQESAVLTFVHNGDGDGPVRVVLVNEDTHEPVSEVESPTGSARNLLFAVPSTAGYQFLVEAPFGTEWQLDVYWAN